MNVIHQRHGEGQQAFSLPAVAMETDYTESVFPLLLPSNDKLIHITIVRKVLIKQCRVNTQVYDDVH